MVRERHDFLWMEGDGFAPAVSGEFSLASVESDHDFLALDDAGECVEEF